MAVDLTSAPYYDKYSADKKYSRVLPIPGRVAQGREIIELQDIQSDYLGRLGNAVFSDGTILGGCEIIANQEQKTVSIADGRVVLGGIVRIVNHQETEIAGAGTENIGLKVEKTIVTEDDDPDLRDPSQDYENYGQPGAHRLKEEVKLVVDDPQAVVIGQLNEGSIVVDEPNPEDERSSLDNLLAKRTFDENGSYKIEGLTLQDRGEHDEEHVYASITEGRAYVEGYEVNKSLTQRIYFNRATDTRTEKNEAHNYVDGTTYDLVYQPVKTLDKVMVKVKKTKDMTRGGIAGGTDYIEDPDDGSVDSIVEVKNQQGEKTYTPDTDYKLSNEGIDWSAGGEEPETGSSYQVTYIFNQTLKENQIEIVHDYIRIDGASAIVTRGESADGKDQITLPSEITKVFSITQITNAKGDKVYSGSDYKLDEAEGVYSVDWADGSEEPTSQEDYIVYMSVLRKTTDETATYAKLAEGAPTPEPGSKMYFDYTYYLARMDLVTLDSNGMFRIYPGQSELMRRALPPINKNAAELTIGNVLVYPNSDRIEVFNLDMTRMTQQNLFNLRQRVDNLEYNIAMTDLDKEAMEGENATQLRGVFTDGFIGLSKADITNKDYHIGMDFAHGWLMLPQHETVTKMTPSTKSLEAMQALGGILTPKYEENLFVDQFYATDSFKVNPYAVYEQLAIIELTPYVDNWVDTEHVTVDGGTTTNYQNVTVNGGTSYSRNYQSRGWGTASTTTYTGSSTSHSSSTTTSTSTSSYTQSEMIVDEAIYYMRPTEVKVKGSNFLLNSDDLVCTFNDIKVDLTPEGQTEAGSTEGSVKCNKEGEFEAKFTVPENVPCGNANVEVNNEYNKSGAIYSAQGRHQVIQDTVFTVRTVTNTTTNYTHVTQNYVTNYYTPAPPYVPPNYDPLAQTFYIAADCVLTKLVLYFHEKDETQNIIIHVRDTENGYPGPHLLAQELIKAADIKVSEDSSVATEIKFSQPVYLKGQSSYCFAILSDSNKYSVWTAKLGGADILLEEAVVKQPFIEGVLFSSSNNAAWTAHQDMDLKFQMYTAKYTPTEIKTELEFDEATIEPSTALILAAQSADYRNDGIEWDIKLGGEGDWHPITPYYYKEMDNEFNKVQVKCGFNVNSENLAGFVNQDNVNLVSYYDETEGTYISRTVVMDEYFNTLVVSLEGDIPQGTSYNIYYSLDNETWNELTEPKVTPMDTAWSRYEYTKGDLPDYTNTYKVKIKMASTSKLLSPRIRRLKSIMKNV